MKYMIVVRKIWDPNLINEKKNHKSEEITPPGGYRLDFYMRTRDARYFLFSQPYSRSVYDYFYNGRYADEVLSYNKWQANRRLSKTIERIPGMVRYVQKEIIESLMTQDGGNAA